MISCVKLEKKDACGNKEVVRKWQGCSQDKKGGWGTETACVRMRQGKIKKVILRVREKIFHNTVNEHNSCSPII